MSFSTGCFLLALFVSNPALALETWSIPQLNKDVPVPAVYVKRDLRDGLSVDHPLMKVVIPKGWSVGITRDDKLQAEIIQIAPNRDVENSPVSLDISRRW